MSFKEEFNKLLKEQEEAGHPVDDQLAMLIHENQVLWKSAQMIGRDLLGGVLPKMDQTVQIYDRLQADVRNESVVRAMYEEDYEEVLEEED